MITLTVLYAIVKFCGTTMLCYVFTIRYWSITRLKKASMHTDETRLVMYS